MQLSQVVDDDQNDPVGQLVAHSDDPCPEYCPESHAAQVDDPVALRTAEKKTAKQLTQLEAPIPD
jgi:hypothetical protein